MSGAGGLPRKALWQRLQVSGPQMKTPNIRARQHGMRGEARGGGGEDVQANSADFTVLPSGVLKLQVRAIQRITAKLVLVLGP